MYKTILNFFLEYGPPGELSVIPQKCSNLISIKIQSTECNVPLTKRVSLKMSVQTLQGIVLKMIGKLQVNKTMPKLCYLDSSRCGIKVPMDNLSKSLDYYSIQDGDTVQVEW